MFRITARTVLELGSELISSDIIAFYELIKNGFDAKTKNGVDVKFNIVLRRNAYLALRTKAQSKEINTLELKLLVRQQLNFDASDEFIKKAHSLLDKALTRQQIVQAIDDIYTLSNIVVSDTGSGMSKDELKDNFLVIGTASRKKEVDEALERGDSKTPYLGEKGIGRLSAMRLGNTLRVETAKSDDAALNTLDINWGDFANIDAMLADIVIKPKTVGDKPNPDWSGTRIIIGALSEDWTRNRVKQMAEYDFARLTDPFVDPKQRPRIAIFWNDDRITIPWMDHKLISNAHASITGHYTIEDGTPKLQCTIVANKLGFDHPRETEPITVPLQDLQSALIGTSNQLPDSALYAIGPFKFEAHWYNRRLLRAIDGVGELKAVRELQERWSGILLYRDGFRVFPYGEDEDDWLALDRKALRRSGYTLNKTQFVGRVEISRISNPELVDQTNREGLRETPEQQIFIEIMQYVIQDLLFRFMKNVEKQYKGQKVDLGDAKSEVDNLNSRAKSALSRLKKIAKKEGDEAIEDLQQTLFQFTEFAEKARQRIEEVEQESRQMVDMAGVGLMVEVVAHELARASENAIENLEVLRAKNVPEEVRTKLESLRSQMKSLSKRIRILDPLSVSGRQRVEAFSLSDLIRETLEAHEAQFERHAIRLDLKLPTNGPRIRAVKGMIVQILENLISNSKYWLELRSARERSFTPRITITLIENPPTIIYEDNGPGIAIENQERIFRSFFSLKEKSKRRGLGLFIARECAEHNGGTLELDSYISPETGRLHRFVFELPRETTK